jgi:hypothetical protein
MRSGQRFALLLSAGAGIGIAIFGVLVYRAVTVEHLEAKEARQRFAAIRATLGSVPSLLTLDDAGNVVRRAGPPPAGASRPTRLAVVVYQADAGRLVSADVPFWFFKLKGPAAQYAFQGTGLDFKRLRITAADLEPYGPAVVIDHTRPSGDRLLVWTE